MTFVGSYRAISLAYFWRVNVCGSHSNVMTNAVTANIEKPTYWLGTVVV